MSKASTAILVAALGAFALGACKQEAAAAPVDVRASMQQQVNPAMLAIWDIGNNAMDDNGGIDVAKMDDAKWAKLAESAGQLSAAAKSLAAATSFAASAPDNAAVGEGEIAMADVQKHLDADPVGFSKQAGKLAAKADEIAAAAQVKDGKAAGDLIGQMDQVCEDCHMVYWYPEQ